jgi:hypothetical protein
VRECGQTNEIFVQGVGCVQGYRETCELFVPAPTVPTFPTDPIEIEGICDGISLGFLPNPSDCTRFVLCIFEIPEFLTCPSQTPIFDKIGEKCVPGNLMLKSLTCTKKQILLIIPAR